uniref:Transmembrane protein 117-like n=1 Tax=Hirondellea gigas TaxID=1518452 RepID=A0A6A7G8X7_9CRUS
MKTVMKVAAFGTWGGDSITVMMVFDMMLQDRNFYSEWATRLRNWWTGRNRIISFWVIMIVLSTLVLLAIGSDSVSWDKYNGYFFHTDEFDRAFLASVITLFDLMIVIQDWEFPHFTTNKDVKLVGTNSVDLRIKTLRKVLNRPFWDVHVEGKWFNYGIISIVMCLDMNMLKNQVLYRPQDYGQFVEPPENTIWNIGSQDRANDPATILNLDNLQPEDYRMNARYNDFSSASLGATAIPAIFGVVMFVFLYWRYNKDMNLAAASRRANSEKELAQISASETNHSSSRKLSTDLANSDVVAVDSERSDVESRNAPARDADSLNIQARGIEDSTRSGE